MGQLSCLNHLRPSWSHLKVVKKLNIQCDNQSIAFLITNVDAVLYFRNKYTCKKIMVFKTKDVFVFFTEY